MKTIRTGITRLTTGQCSRIAGGDPGMALAGMGVGYQGGPMAVVTIGLPGDAPLSGFDKWLIGTAGGVAGGLRRLLSVAWSKVRQLAPCSARLAWQ